MPIFKYGIVVNTSTADFSLSD